MTMMIAFVGHLYDEKGVLIDCEKSYYWQDIEVVVGENVGVAGVANVVVVVVVYYNN